MRKMLYGIWECGVSIEIAVCDFFTTVEIVFLHGRWGETQEPLFLTTATTVPTWQVCLFSFLLPISIYCVIWMFFLQVYIPWNSPKSREGGLKQLQTEHKVVTVTATGGNRCPVSFFDSYISKFPVGARKRDLFFSYLHPTVPKNVEDPWHMNSPVGKNKLTLHHG